MLAGFSAQCAPEGSGDVGAGCTTSGDCFGGLSCNLGKCGQPLPGAPAFGLPTWGGVACEPSSTGTVRAYFEVPGVQSPAGQEGDFFRLPFPNDVRIVNGKLDLTGFPTPGPDYLGFDPLQPYIDALSKESAWGTYETVTFRFSGPIDFATFSDEPNKKYAINWVDITPGTPEYGNGGGAYWIYDPNPGHYVCQNAISIRRPQGVPLMPGRKYAVYITTMGLDQNGKPIERSPHLTAVLANASPSDPKLLAAHTTFKPFRDFLADKLIDPSTIMNATVITTGPVRDTMQQLADAVEAAPLPTAKSWVKCDAGVTSPCPQAEDDRACGDGSSPDYDEYHALVTLPIFQQGTAPYEKTGGDIVTSAPVRNEDVCMSITIPKGVSMPASGWPLVVFAHGTGGSFRSHVRPEVAGELAKSASPTAVLGFDQVQHGPRRGASTASPNNLFFNFENPSAARGNPLQGAADQLAVARFAAALDATAADTGGDAIKIDPAGIAFYGHSQGSTHGSLALPYSDIYKATVLSGNGASLIQALLNKTQPVNIAGALPFVLADFDSNGDLYDGDAHPALSILQQWIDPADPVNYGAIMALTPLTGHTSKHVFQTYGTGDHYSPAATLATYTLAAGLELATADASVTSTEPIGKLKPVGLPLAGNISIGGTPFTLGVREYSGSAASDGHFVAFDVPSATSDVVRFLSMGASGQTPQVGP